MPQYKIQFQSSMLLSELIERFGSEEHCKAALEKVHRLSGFLGPECGKPAHSAFLIEERKHGQGACGRVPTAARSGRLSHSRRLPQNKSFQAMVSDE